MPPTADVQAAQAQENAAEENIKVAQAEADAAKTQTAAIAGRW